MKYWTVIDEDGHDAYLEQMKQEGREKDDPEDEDYVMNFDSDASGMKDGMESRSREGLGRVGLNV